MQPEIVTTAVYLAAEAEYAAAEVEYAVAACSIAQSSEFIDPYLKTFYGPIFVERIV